MGANKNPSWCKHRLEQRRLERRLAEQATHSSTNLSRVAIMGTKTYSAALVTRASARGITRENGYKVSCFDHEQTYSLLQYLASPASALVLEVTPELPPQFWNDINAVVDLTSPRGVCLALHPNVLPRITYGAVANNTADNLAGIVKYLRELR